MLCVSGIFWTTAPAEILGEIVCLVHHPLWFLGSERVNPSGLLYLSRGGKPKSIWGQLPRLGPKGSSTLYFRAFCSSEISHHPKSLLAASKFLSSCTAPFTKQDFKPKPNTTFINNGIKEKRNHNFLCRFTAVLMVFTLHFHTSIRWDLSFQHALHTGLQL